MQQGLNYNVANLHSYFQIQNESENRNTNQQNSSDVHQKETCKTKAVHMAA